MPTSSCFESGPKLDSADGIEGDCSSIDAEEVASAAVGEGEEELLKIDVSASGLVLVS